MSKERWLTGTYLVQLRGCSNTSKNKMEHNPAQLPQVKNHSIRVHEAHLLFSTKENYLMKIHLLVIIKNTAWYHFLFLYIMRWEEKQKWPHSGCSQVNMILGQDAWAWKQRSAADTHGNSTKSPCLQTAAGQRGSVTSLLAALASSAKISHCKSTVVRVK